MTTKIQNKTQWLESVDGMERSLIAVGDYKGTMTDPVSRKYSPWSGNVAMHDGVDDRGNAVTVYYKTVDCRVAPVFAR